MSPTPRSDHLLAVNVGNTHIHVALRQNGESLASLRLASTITNEQLQAELSAWLCHCVPVGTPMVTASVVPRLSPTMRTVAHACGYPCCVLGEDMPVPIINRTARPELVGVDRLLTALAAYALTGSRVIVVDMGTAITVDLVSDTGAFLGGAIAPGTYAALNGLLAATAQLRPIQLVKAPPALGVDTEGAMQSGLFHGYAGLVTGLINAIDAGAQPRSLVVATGGDAKMFATHVRFDHVISDLILQGIELAYARA